MIGTIIVIIIWSLICGLAGVTIHKQLQKPEYKPQLYTLVIEDYLEDFDESSYQTIKFSSRTDRDEFIHNYTIECLNKDFTQNGRILSSPQGTIIKILHETD